MERENVMAPQPSEQCVWTRVKPLKRSRTVCDLSVLMQQCHDEETKNRDLSHVSATRRNIDGSRKLRRINATSEPMKLQSFASDHLTRNLKCPFFEPSPTEKHESNSVTGDRTIIYNSHQTNIEISVWEEFTFLCIGEKQLLFKNNLNVIPSSQTPSDEKCIDRLVDIQA